MNKKEFLAALRKGLPGQEQEKWLDFYSEMIDDRMEDGMREADAVAAVGKVEDILAQILVEAKPGKKKRRELKTWQTVLLIVGSSLWFSLLIAVASVVFSLLVSAWAVVIGFYAVAVSLVACGLAGLALLILFLIKGNVVAALFAFGAGLLSAGLGIFWFIGTHYATKGVIWLCKKLFSVLLPRKEAAA